MDPLRCLPNNNKKKNSFSWWAFQVMLQTEYTVQASMRNSIWSWLFWILFCFQLKYKRMDCGICLPNDAVRTSVHWLVDCATRTPADFSSLFASSDDVLSFSPLTWILCFSLKADISCSFVKSVSFNLVMRPPIYRQDNNRITVRNSKSNFELQTLF